MINASRPRSRSPRLPTGCHPRRRCCPSALGPGVFGSRHFIILFVWYRFEFSHLHRNIGQKSSALISIPFRESRPTPPPFARPFTFPDSHLLPSYLITRKSVFITVVRVTRFVALSGDTPHFQLYSGFPGSLSRNLTDSELQNKHRFYRIRRRNRLKNKKSNRLKRNEVR